MDYVSLGRSVRKWRKKLHLTQEELAEKVDLSPSFLGHVERGTRILSVDTLVKLCDVLGVTANDLLGMGPDSLRSEFPTNWTAEHCSEVAALAEEISRVVRRRQAAATE